MELLSLYSKSVWKNYSEKFGTSKKEFELKKYPHLDPFFNFFDHKEKIHNLISDPTLQSVASHSFIPFVKILTKTPRYKYQENEKCYSLETKIRPIAFASHFDTYLYGYYAYALNERYQGYIKSKGFTESVLAYRTDLDGNCNIQFAKEAFDKVKNKLAQKNECVAIALDITGYFDNIDHNILKEKWCQILNTSELPLDQYKIFRTLTKYSYINYNSFLKFFDINVKSLKKENIRWNCLLDLMPDHLAGATFVHKLNHLRKSKLIVPNLPKKDKKEGTIEYRGIPQGSSMSAVLSNIYLIDFDSWLFHLGKRLGFSYRRYCDDLLIICNPDNADYLKQIVFHKIKEYKLAIQEKKTEVIKFQLNSKGKYRSYSLSKLQCSKIALTPENEASFEKKLQYLGFEFNGENIYIRSGSLSRYFRKMKGRIVKNVMMAYSDRSKKGKILKRKLYNLYSHTGRRNFISYALKAAKKEYKNKAGKSLPGLDSKSIHRQIAAHFTIIEKEVEKTSKNRFLHKEAKRQAKIETGKRAKAVRLKL